MQERRKRKRLMPGCRVGVLVWAACFLVLACASEPDYEEPFGAFRPEDVQRELDALDDLSQPQRVPEESLPQGSPPVLTEGGAAEDTAAADAATGGTVARGTVVEVPSERVVSSGGGPSGPSPSEVVTRALPGASRRALPAPVGDDPRVRPFLLEPLVGTDVDEGLLLWGRDYRSYHRVSGLVNSVAHGYRLGIVYVNRADAVQVYQHNARLVRERRQRGYRRYPPGTVIVQESWLSTPQGPKGRKDLLFLMRKEVPGFDPQHGDWYYGLARADLSLIAEGAEGRVQFCKGCHTKAPDAIFARNY